MGAVSAWPEGDESSGDRPALPLAVREGDRGGSRMADGDRGECGWPADGEAEATAAAASGDDEPSCCKMSCSAVSAADCDAPRRRLGTLPIPMPYVERCTGLPRRVDDAPPALDEADDDDDDDMMPAATELDSPTALLLLRIGWATANDRLGDEEADEDGSSAAGGVTGFDDDDDDDDEVEEDGGGAGERAACDAWRADASTFATGASPASPTTKGDEADATGSAAALHEKPLFCCGVDAAPPALALALVLGVLNPIVDRLTMTGDEVEVDAAPMCALVAPLGVAAVD